jgi:lysophospholipase L1-like esterase
MRRIVKVLITTVLASVVVAVPSAQSAAGDETATHYYLALGDSLAAEPDGYVSRVHAALSATDPKLTLNNISCGGESAVSMRYGSQLQDMASSCGTPRYYRYLYPHGTQIDEAVSFLHAHKGKVDLITIDIGANDVLPCIPALEPACVGQGLERIAVNVDQIVAELRAAAPGVRVVAMTYYNPFACAQGVPFPPGLPAASQHVLLSTNAVLLDVFGAHGIEVTDVAGVFAVADLAASAQTAAAWTWFCNPDRLGDPHPNSAGHQVIADAFLDVLAG